MSKLWYTIPGIMSQIDDPARWHLRAQLWLHDRGAKHVATYQYSAGAIGATLDLSRQVQQVYSDILDAERAGFDEVIIIGHSNAGRIVSRLLWLLDGRPNPTLTLRANLFAPACEEGCDANNLNRAASIGLLTHASIYSSPKDEVLPLTRFTATYGALGLVGPQNVKPPLAAVLRDIRRDCTHGQWVNEDLYTNLNEIWNLEQARGLAADSPASAPATHETPGAALPNDGFDL